MGETDEKRLLGFWGPGPGMRSPSLQLLGDIPVIVDLAGFYYPRDPCLAIPNRPLAREYSPKYDESRGRKPPQRWKGGSARRVVSGNRGGSNETRLPSAAGSQ